MTSPNPCLHMYRSCLKAEIHPTDIQQPPKTFFSQRCMWQTRFLVTQTLASKKGIYQCNFILNTCIPMTSPNPCLHMYRSCLKAEIHPPDIPQPPKTFFSQRCMCQTSSLVTQTSKLLKKVIYQCNFILNTCIPMTLPNPSLHMYRSCLKAEIHPPDIQQPPKTFFSQRCMCQTSFLVTPNLNFLKKEFINAISF